MPRPLLALLLALAACRDRPVESRRDEVEALCDEFCPQRVDCVRDGWADNDVDDCVALCAADERLLEDNACGEASLAALECLAATACADLPAAVRASAGDGSAPCYAELRAQRDRCDL